MDGAQTMAISRSVLPSSSLPVTLPLATISALANRLTRHEIQSIRLKSLKGCSAFMTSLKHGLQVA